MTSHTITDTNHWHQLRAKHIGASEVSALFNLSPWMTRWQLYMVKTGRLPDVGETAAMTQGKHFEPAVAAYAQEKFGIKLQKVHRYLTCDDTPGLGASLDYETAESPRVPVELKFSMWGDFEVEGDEIMEAPDQYVIQVQHQLACVPSAPHGLLIAFTRGDLKRMIIPRNEDIIGAIKTEVRQFWDDVQNGNEPPVDFTVDSDAVKRLAYAQRLRSVTLQPAAAGLFEKWERQKSLADQAYAQVEAAKAEIIKMVIDAGEGNDEKVRATCGPWKMNLTKIADNPGKVVTEEMLGQVIGTRKGHIRTTIKKDSG